VDIIDTLDKEQKLADYKEARVKEFFPALKASLINGENPFRVFLKLIEQDLPLYFTRQGYVHDDATLKHVRTAIIIADRINTIMAEDAVVEVHLGPDSSTEPLCDMYVRLEDVERMYERLGIEEIPWPGKDEHGEAFVDACRLDEIKSRKEEIQTLLNKLPGPEQYKDLKAELIALEKEEVEIINRRKGKRQDEEIENDKEITVTTSDRHIIWANTISQCQKEAKNHIQGSNLALMSEEAAKKLLDENKLDNPKRDPFYERYYPDNSSRPDIKKLTQTIRTTISRHGSFTR